MIEDAMMTDQVTVNAEWLAELQRENERQRARLNDYAKEFKTCSQCQSCGRLYQVSEGCLPCEVRRLRGALVMIREITGQDAVFHEADSALEGR